MLGAQVAGGIPGEQGSDVGVNIDPGGGERFGYGVPVQQADDGTCAGGTGQLPP